MNGKIFMRIRGSMRHVIAITGFTFVKWCNNPVALDTISDRMLWCDSPVVLCWGYAVSVLIRCPTQHHHIMRRASNNPLFHDTPQVQSADWLLSPVCRQRLMLNVTDTKSPLLSQTYRKYRNIKKNPALRNLLWYIVVFFVLFFFWKHWSGMKSLTSPTPAWEDCDVCWHSSGNAAWVEWESNVSMLALNILLVSLI